jgi:hypothetical protein
LVDLRRLRAAGDALAAEAEAKRGLGFGGEEEATPTRPASPAALAAVSRPSSTESLDDRGAAKEKKSVVHKKRQAEKQDPAVGQYLGELSRLRAEAERAFGGGGGGGGERERGSAAA